MITLGELFADLESLFAVYGIRDGLRVIWWVAVYYISGWLADGFKNWSLIAGNRVEELDNKPYEKEY